MTDNQRNVRIGKFRAHPIERMGDNSVERVQMAKHSGKIILPPSVLRRISRINQSLMIFKLINDELDRHLFCGVSSFDGNERMVSVPLWIQKQLQINTGEEVSVELVLSVQRKGNFAKFQPLSKSFLEITDPKAVLEHCLRNYVVISREDVISIYYNGNIYDLRVSETLPNDTIIINECDLTVDFEQMKKEIKTPEELPEECDLDQIKANLSNNDFEAFSGLGQSVGGKHVISDQINGKPTEKVSQNQSKPYFKRGIPDYDYKMGSLWFKRHKSDLISTDDSKTNSEQQKQMETNRGQQNQKTVNKTTEDEKTALRRPVTRSQTKRANDSKNESSVESQNTSDQKKRKKSSDKRNGNNV